MSLPTLLRSRFGGLGSPFWALMAGLFLNRAGQFVQPMLVWWLTGAQGMSLTEAGGVVSIYGLGGAVGMLAGGVVADRLGRKVALLISSLGAMVFLLLLPMAAGPAAIVLGAAALAFTYDLHRPAVQAMVADLVPPADRLRAYALTYVTVNLGFAVAPALAGVLAESDVSAPFFAAAATQALWAFFVWRRLPETRPAPSSSDPPEGGLGEVLADTTYLRWLLAIGLSSLLPFQAFVVLAAWMKQEGLQPSTFGAILGLNGVLIVLIQPWVAPWVARHDPVRTQAFAFALQGVGFALHGLGLGVPGHLVAVMVWTAGEILAAPVTSAVVARLAPVHLRGRYQGLLGTTFGLAGMLGPAGGAAILDHFGGWIWPVCLALGLTSAAVMLRQGPRLRARFAAQTEAAAPA